jgi:glycosyltransferase involved in cell wall biosynthesis
MKYFLSLLFSLLLLPLNAVEQQSVAIFTYKVYGADPWDPDSVKKGLNGSEEAIVYLSEKLAKAGYKVTVFANPPQDSVHSKIVANPRYLDTAAHDGSKFDHAIAWRMPYNGPLLKELAKKVYLWPHDIFVGQPLTPEQIAAFDDVIWLSEWQRKQWSEKNPGLEKFKSICGNGINPDQFPVIKEKKNPHSCIYGSNYARGLEILLDIWPNIKKEVPDATLDIYYGWQHWGLLSAEKEAKLRKQVLDLASMDVKEHGSVSHEELNEAYAQAAVWAYPCTDTEVFCITALRAQLSGALPAIIQRAALGETVQSGFSCDTPTHYQETLLKALKESEKISLEERKKMGEFILKNHTWEQVAKRCHNIFQRSSNVILEKDENCPLCSYFLAESLLEKGEKELALAEFLKRTKLGGNQVQLFKANLKAAHLMREMNYPPPQVIEVYNAAQKIAPDSIEPKFYLSQLHNQLGHYSFSYEILKESKKEQGPAWIMDWGWTRQLALTCFHLEKFKEAEELFTKLKDNKKLPSWYKKEALSYCRLSSEKATTTSKDEKKVLLAILARNKAHVLPLFLKCIDNLEYDKKLITVYINTNNNKDNTVELLENWMKQNKLKYAEVVYDHHEIEIDDSAPHAWTEGRVRHLAKIRAESLRKTKEYGCDYYFVADIDNFVTPCTLRELIKKDKPIIAPMLKAIPEPSDFYSNFFYEISENGYFKDHPNFFKILHREMTGTFKVPVVHCTYLVKAEYIDKLVYEDGTNAHEFIIFCKSARKHNIDQYICNEKDFGLFLNFFGDPGKLTLEDEKIAFDSFLEMYRDLKLVGALM